MRYHFSGIAGAGMAPLACLMRCRGHDVQGSDRAIDQGKSSDVAARLRAAGIVVLPHDGSAFDHCTHLAVSNRARELHISNALPLRVTL